MTATNYLPPLRFHVLTYWYDRLIPWSIREKRFKRALLARLSLRPDGTLLDLGCGTGTMTWWIRDEWPDIDIVGVDADPAALAIARGKRPAGAAQVTFIHTLAQSLELAASSVDVVISSLFFHHLADTDKDRVLREASRVLRPDGRFLVADWGRSESWWLRWAFVAVRCLDGFARTRANAQGRLPAMMEHAGFEAPQVFDRVATIFGEIHLLEARLEPAVS